jgi:hypothetical protein
VSKRNEIRPRGVPIEVAAAYVGLSVKRYREAVRRNLYPGPLVDPKTGVATNRYDLKAIDLVMDRMSGIEADGVSRQSAWESWIAENDKGQLSPRLGSSDAHG